MALDVAAAREDEFHSADHLRLFFRSWRKAGVTAQRLVILVHGFADHSGRYEAVIQHLCARGAVVYSYDQRGNGLSAGRRGHVMRYDELVEDLDAFIALAVASEPGLERVLLAHSTGALPALSFALANPGRIDRLVLSAPALILSAKTPRWKTSLATLLSGIAPRFSMKAGFNPNVLSRDVDHVLKTVADPLVTQAMSTRFYHEVYVTAAPALINRIADLKVPFIYVQGDADRLVSPSVAEEFRTRATVAHEIHVYPGSFHELLADVDRETVFADIDRWLEAPLAS